MWREGSPNTRMMVLNWHTHYEKVVWRFLTALKYNYRMILHAHFWVFMQRTEVSISKRYLHSYVHCVSINSQDMKTTQVSSSSSVQSLSRVRLFATPWTAARQASLVITNSRRSLRLTSIESVMPSSHLILGRPLLRLMDKVNVAYMHTIEYYSA